MKPIIINGKFLAERMQGIVRYAREMVTALDGLLKKEDRVWLAVLKNAKDIPDFTHIRVIRVGSRKGLLWEQIELRRFAAHRKNSILLNFCNISPFFPGNSITTVHDIMYCVNPSHYTSPRNRVSRLWHMLQYRYLFRHERMILTDSRFDFSDAYILSTGCAGSAMDNSVMGDVFVITSAVDYDLGHHADPRDMEDDTAATWFHDADFDSAAVVHLDSVLMDRVYSLVKDIPLETTERTRDFMSRAFDGADWAVRDPKVLRGTTVTGDNYWKGRYGHANALLMTQTYGCSDPYATTEMEDIAIARTAKQLGMLDRLIILRDSVNMDTFMLGATPESLWDPEHDNSDVSNENSEEYIDIFATARENNFIVGRTIIDAILEGNL